jgi:hypothetical protein
MNAAVPLRERVLAAAVATPSLTRPQGRRLAACLAVLSVVLAFAIFEIAGGLAHAQDRPLLASARLADGWGLASAALLWLVLGRHSRTIFRSPPLLRAATWASPVWLLAWIPKFAGAETGLEGAAGCFGLTLALSATPLASFLALRRGAEPECPGTLGAAAGAAFGACAQVLVLLFCPVSDVTHGVVGHALPLAVLAVIGGVAGRSVLGTARRRRVPYCETKPSLPRSPLQDPGSTSRAFDLRSPVEQHVRVVAATRREARILEGVRIG